MGVDADGGAFVIVGEVAKGVHLFLGGVGFEQRGVDDGGDSLGGIEDHIRHTGAANGAAEADLMSASATAGRVVSKQFSGNGFDLVHAKLLCFFVPRRQLAAGSQDVGALAAPQGDGLGDFPGGFEKGVYFSLGGAAVGEGWNGVVGDEIDFAGEV